MSLSSIRKKGYLYKLPVTGIVRKWSKRWFVLYATTIEGVVRIEYYDNESCEATQIGKRTIPLRDSMGISQSVGHKAHPHVFEFTSQIGHHVFAVESQKELDEWLTAITEAVKADRTRMSRKTSQALSMSSEQQGQDSVDGGDASRKTSQSSYYEPNTTGTYRVTLEQNETAQRLKLSAAYNLEITPQGILLIAANSGANIAWWHYKHVKTYGRASGTFNIEVGKGAETGFGTFVFATTCGREIFGVVHRNIKRLKGEKEKDRAERGKEDAAMLQKKIDERQQQPVLKHRPGSAKYNLADKKRHRPPPKKPAPYASNELSSGTYRRSKDFDEIQTPSPPPISEEQSSTQPPIYAVVKKPKKGSSSYHKDPGPPTHVQPTAAGTATILPSKFNSSNFDGAMLAAATSLPPTASMTTNGTEGRFSYTSRDSRDSALLDYVNPLAEDLPPLTSGVENPLDNIPDSDMNLVTDIDEFDDQLFETLAEMEVQDEITDLSLVGQKATSLADRPQNKPVSVPGSRKTERRMSQQEFDKIWDDICATIPDGSEF